MRVIETEHEAAKSVSQQRLLAAVAKLSPPNVPRAHFVPTRSARACFKHGEKCRHRIGVPRGGTKRIGMGGASDADNELGAWAVGREFAGDAAKMVP
jgi:hypothetical protein